MRLKACLIRWLGIPKRKGKQRTNLAHNKETQRRDGYSRRVALHSIITKTGRDTMTTVTLLSDIPYAKADDIELQLDLYRPDIAGRVPSVIYLHGGGWGAAIKQPMLKRV